MTPASTGLPGLTIDDEFHRLVDELTRRGFLGGGLTAAALAGLAACSPDTPVSSPAASWHNVQTIHGKVRVPNDPKRIIATDFPEACALLDLGVIPAGRPSFMPEFPAYTKAVAGVPIIDEVSSGDLVIEKIASLRPDLIVGDDWADPSKQRTPYAKLAVIAPTALFAWEAAAGNWPDLAAQTAAAVGKTKQLNALKAQYTANANAIRNTYSDLLSRTRWDLIDLASSGLWDLYSATSSHGKVAAQAGVRFGAAAQQTDEFVQYSLERLELLQHTDVIVTDPVSLVTFQRNGLFQRLPAVKAGHVYTTSLFFPASYGVAIALLDVLDTICAKLQENH